jgi:hypothetical protein
MPHFQNSLSFNRKYSRVPRKRIILPSLLSSRRMIDDVLVDCYNCSLYIKRLKTREIQTCWSKSELKKYLEYQGSLLEWSLWINDRYNDVLVLLQKALSGEKISQAKFTELMSTIRISCNNFNQAMRNIAKTQCIKRYPKLAKRKQ